MKFDVNQLRWTRQPKSCTITPAKIEIVTLPHTDLWQRTYYISAMTTLRYCRCPPPNVFSPL